MSRTNMPMADVPIRRPIAARVADLPGRLREADERPPMLRRRRPLSARGIALVAGAGVAVSLGLAVTFSLAKDKSEAPSRSVKVDVQAPAEPRMAAGAAGSAYGDWVVRCQDRACETSQTIVTQNRRTPVAQIALTRTGAAGLKTVVLLPVNVSFESNVRVLTGNNAAGVMLAWHRCMPRACVAAATISEGAVSQLRDGGRLVYQQASGQQITLPLSFNGLAQSLSALGGQQRESIGLK